MRKLLTGFVAGTLVTILAMLAILGDRSDDTAPFGNDEEGPAVVASPSEDPQVVERRRRAALFASSPDAADSGEPGRPAELEGEAPRSGESGSTDCCTFSVVPDPGASIDVDDSVAVSFPDQTAPGIELSRPYLSGKWEGVMTGIGALLDDAPSVVPPFDEARGKYGFRLDIRETHLVMYFQNGDQWISLGDGQDLRTNEQGRSAIVITSLDAANGGIEAMVLNIVRWDENTIAVHMSRVTGAGPAGGSLPPPANSMGILNRAVF